MRNLTLHRGALPALAAACLAVACGGTDSSLTPDRYSGVVDPTAFDGKFLPVTSTSSTAVKALCGATPLPCYPAQKGFAHGKSISFYNLLQGGSAVRTAPSATTNLFPLAAKSQTQVFNFPANCNKGPAFNPVADAYTREVQYPIFTSPPLATTVFGVVVMPLVSIYGVTAANNTCNDMKSADSIAAGDFGAQPTATPASTNLWAMIDPNANFTPIGSATPPLYSAWYKALQGFFIDGGKVPVDSSGSIVPMDGVIINGANGFSCPQGKTDPIAGCANAFDNQAVILPAVRGEDAFSPVVRLRQFQLPAGKKLGDYTDLCQPGATCAANQVPMASTTSSFNTIFIVAPPQ